MISTRTIAWLGLGTFLLLAVGTVIEPLWDFPGTNASDAEIETYFAANRDGILAMMIAYGFTMGLFLAFAVGLWSWLRHRPQVDDAAAAVFGAGAVSLTAVVLAGFAPMLVLAYRSPGASAADVLYDLTFAVLAMSGIPTAVALFAYAAVVFRSVPALVPWTAHIAALGALAHVVVALTFVASSGFFSLQGEVIWVVPGTLFLWVLATSVALLRVREARPEP